MWHQQPGGRALLSATRGRIRGRRDVGGDGGSSALALLDHQARAQAASYRIVGGCSRGIGGVWFRAWWDAARLVAQSESHGVQAGGGVQACAAHVYRPQWQVIGRMRYQFTSWAMDKWLALVHAQKEVDEWLLACLSSPSQVEEEVSLDVARTCCDVVF